MNTTTAKPSKLLLALGVAFLAVLTPALAEDGTLRVGIITDMSGQYADGNGTGSVVAAQMAAEEIGGTVAGRKIEIISADHQNKPDVAVGIAPWRLKKSSANTRVSGVLSQ